jgi:hypothetical protein
MDFGESFCGFDRVCPDMSSRWRGNCGYRSVTSLSGSIEHILETRRVAASISGLISGLPEGWPKPLLALPVDLDEIGARAADFARASRGAATEHAYRSD